jgi:hypothetical protein
MASKNRKSTYQNKPTWPNNSFLCQSHRCAVYNAASLNTNSLTCKCWHQLLLWHLEKFKLNSAVCSKLHCVNSKQTFLHHSSPFLMKHDFTMLSSIPISDPLHKMESLAISITPRVSGATVFYWHVTFQLHFTQVWQLRKRNQMKP